MEEAKFFNYNEYSIEPINRGTLPDDLCATHFPDVYREPVLAKDGKTDVNEQKYRVVRIPRRFDTSLTSPCFSNLLPGLEPAALISDEEEDQHKFKVLGDIDGIGYGISSVSPLSLYFSEEEFRDIVDVINGYLEKGFGSVGLRQIIIWIIDLLSLGIFNILLEYFKIGPLWQLEKYIKDINQTSIFTSNEIRIISPKRSGYASLDFEVPTPSYDKAG